VTFAVYDPSGNAWTTLQATVDPNGYAVSDYVTLGAYNASVGTWEVQANVTDASSGGEVHNAGFYRRSFRVQHSTEMTVKYPVDGVSTWSVNVTYGDIVLLQLRVNDSDNGDLLPEGTMTYVWDSIESGTANDLGTGEYSITLNTSKVTAPGRYDVSLSWSKNYYDSLQRTFTVNVIFTSELFSPDAPGVDVPKGYNAETTLYFEDQLGNGINGAKITCNWSDPYKVTPVSGSDGYYTLSLETTNINLATYAVNITASKDYLESRSIVLSVQVRELHTSAIPSTSHLSLPVGYVRSFTVTYTDTDHDMPITGAESQFALNWTGSHGYYTVEETSSPGVYNITIQSVDTDTLTTYVIEVNVTKYGAQNHTFYVEVELRTRLTSFYLTNPVDPTPYTANFTISVVYYDMDADTGIVNSTENGYYVYIYVVSDLPSLSYTVEEGSSSGEYIITIPASEWGSIGSKNITIHANWTGPTVKYSNKTIDLTVTVTPTPTDIFIGENPILTPYGENITFTLIYYDVGAQDGIVNSTGSYAGNVMMTVTVLTTGTSLSQSVMVITEIDPTNNPGEYRIEFNTTFLNNLNPCDLEIWFNWTKGQLPLYENKSLIVTVYPAQRQTVVEWNPLPVTPYDELVNLSIIYRDSASGDPIANSSQLYISIQESVTYQIYYDASNTRFLIELDTSSWTPGDWTFHVNITWVGTPFYQNRTSVAVHITVRYRYTELIHGAYTSTQFANNLTIVFSYRDLDDYTTAGMQGATLTLDPSLMGYYWVTDNADGTYTLVLNTQGFGVLGTFTVNATIVYGGTRYCENATDTFYLTVVERRTQLTSELPSLTPYLSQANITVTYIDDNTNQPIAGANFFASCASAAEELILGVNYWVDYLPDGSYRIRISTQALGTFGSHSIVVVANYTGAPYYQERTISVDIEVSRRPVGIAVTRSPLNTQFLDNVVFQILVTDELNGSEISLDSTVLEISHGSGVVVPASQYVITKTEGGYTIAINSTVLTSVLVDNHPITVRFFWGDRAPYYTNATTSTEVTITRRATQVAVVSTPPADIMFNATALISYLDYDRDTGIAGATVTLACSNVTSIQYWFIDLGNGLYEIRVNTTPFTKIGKYLFTANVSITGAPFYQNQTGVEFSILVNPISTTLTVMVPSGTTYYVGDTLHLNITFVSITTGAGVENALVQTNWATLYGTAFSITELGDGIYELVIQTPGLDAGRYEFDVNASKALHYNKSITADIVLAPIPVSIAVSFAPDTPSWGDYVTFDANVTDARTGDPVTGANVTLTMGNYSYQMTESSPGTYTVTIPTSNYVSGEYTVTIRSELKNYETHEADSEIRISKLPAVLSASIDTTMAVNGQTVTIEASYEMASNGSAIGTASVTYSWTGGQGVLTWNPSLQKYSGQFIISGVPVGSYQIVVRAQSANFKSATTQLAIEIRAITTKLTTSSGTYTMTVIYGDTFNITVYLNNTDLNQPVDNASVSYIVGSLEGNLTGTGVPGYYSTLVPTAELGVRRWVMTISASKVGHTPSSTQVTITIVSIPTRAEIVGNARLEVYYGRNATFRLVFWDTYNDVAIPNATASFELGSFRNSLVDLGNGTYELVVNSKVVAAGPVGYNIIVSFMRANYDSAFTSVQLVVKPIPTAVVGPTETDFPVGDDYSMTFTFTDTLNGGPVVNATAAVIWEFGTVALTPLGNGSYVFGPTETGVSRLEVRDTPYELKVSVSRPNYTAATLEVRLTIRLIATKLIVDEPPATVYDGQEFTVRITYWDVDHGIPIPDAFNDTSGTTLDLVSDLCMDYGNGTYVFGFVGHGIQAFDLRIALSQTDHETQTYSVVIYTIMTPEAQAAVTSMGWAAAAIMLLSAFAALYIKVLSVPKMLRKIRSMEATVRKGGVPTPAAVRDRRAIIRDMMNEDLESVRILKTLEDVAPSTVDVSMLDVEALLQELAELVGLTEKDVDILRADLEKMRPSERAGFVQEVIRQERARRAREIAEAKEAEKPPEELKRKLTEEELAHLKEKLMAAGIEESEADLMVEQARNLTKAEIDALLDQLEGKEE